MDVDFTAKIEGDLDEIARGKQDWQPVLREFYAPFTTSVKLAMEIAKRVPRNQIDEETNEVCEACERPMVIKSGRFGKFLSCSGFPKCKTSRPFLIKVGVKCPECSSDLVELKGKSGKRFYGCSAYPNCSFSTNRKPIPQPCPECSKLLVATRRNYSQCTSCEYNGPTPEDQPIEVAV
jgi:DNA topoisomerase-1